MRSIPDRRLAGCTGKPEAFIPHEHQNGLPAPSFTTRSLKNPQIRHPGLRRDDEQKPIIRDPQRRLRMNARVGMISIVDGLVVEIRWRRSSLEGVYG
ncbi:MAG: hypothetical protein ACREPY_07885 [Rhodanobacteraceae bacterium]